MKQIELKIVTPEKVLYQGMVDAVSVSTREGEITVLPDHLPIIAAIKPGELRIKVDGKVNAFSITRGVAEVDGKTITILTDAAEKAEEIDEKRAEEARKKAKDIMAGVRGDEEKYVDAVAHLERALSRLRIARRRKSGGHMPNLNQ
jgi:F-type H+-transporting ATPase subunit epsilon